MKAYNLIKTEQIPTMKNNLLNINKLINNDKDLYINMDKVLNKKDVNERLK